LAESKVADHIPPTTGTTFDGEGPSAHSMITETFPLEHPLAVPSTVTDETGDPAPLTLVILSVHWPERREGIPKAKASPSNQGVYLYLQ
jgi:hypothetical protein